jgi:glycosyltransferase involved in cell wall biosynthesis
MKADPDHLAPVRGAARRPKALLLAAHEPTLDPRIDWFAEGLSADFDVCELGVDAAAKAPSVQRVSPRRTRVRVDGRHVSWDALAPHATLNAETLGVRTIKNLLVAGQLPARALAESVGATGAVEAGLVSLRWSCLYFVRTNSALIEAGRRIGGFDVVVAADLDTLPAALTLAEQYGVPLIYDAHEYWPYAFSHFQSWESEFWREVERSIIGRVTLPLTVSPQLAAIMSDAYGVTFDCVPNCAPLGCETAIDLEAALATRASSKDVIFLYQGVIAPQRGIEKLVGAWGKVDKRAKLWLRGPDGPDKSALMEQARKTGLIDQGVFFPDAVSEVELIAAARQADIGLIPYEPISLNNRYCCPNKLSQYMAAGLPVICNRLDYVRSVVVDNGIGTSVDFSDEGALVRAIDDYVLKRDAIPAMSRKSQEVFTSAFNWQSASRTLYDRIGELVRKTGTKGTEFAFAWIDGPEPWRSEASGQEEQISALNQEISRLHTVYTEHQVMMQSEIDSLRKRCAEETEKLANAPLSLIAYFGLRRVALLLKGLGGALTARSKRL